MSALPALEDLRVKALVDADPRLQLTQDGERKVVLVTPSTILQEQEESRRSCPLRISFQCSRLKPSHPPYQPLPNHTSNVLWTWWKHQSFWIRCLFTVVPALAIGGCICLGLLTAMDLFSMDSHKDNHHPDTRWWEDAVFYEIFPASYLDTDGDGYGDFLGIVRKLDYIQSLGCTAIRLNSIFGALDYPLEYEHVIDLMTPDPHLGRTEDFRVLVKEAHRRGLKVVLDLNPTITSDQHTWALHWQREIPGYEQFYASTNRSRDPPEMEQSEGPPPDEWELTQRVFGGHYTVNWSCPTVQEEYLRTLEHWTGLGVDGFYMKHLERLHVSSPRDLHRVLKQWRKTLGVLIASSKFAQHLEAEMDGRTKEWHEILDLIDLLDHPLLVGSGEEMASQVATLGRRRLSGRTPLWHLGSVDTFRLASRIDTRYQTAALLLLMILPGSASVFYGDEIGLKDSYDPLTGRVYRGGQLTPMQWTDNNATWAGFTSNATEPWLPLNPEHETIQRQKYDRMRQFSRIVRFRRSSAPYGGPVVTEVLDPNVLILERKHRHHPFRRILLAANFGDLSEEKEFPDAYGNVRPLLTTPEPTRTRIRSRSFTLSPGAAFVVEVQLLYQ